MDFFFFAQALSICQDMGGEGGLGSLEAVKAGSFSLNIKTTTCSIYVKCPEEVNLCMHL